MESSTNKTTYNAFIMLCITLIFLTSSFDIVANIDVFGFNLRFCQILSLFIITIWFIESARKKIRLPIGSGYLFCWIAIQFLFIFRSLELTNAIGYFAWLIFDILLIFVLVQYVGKIFSLQWLLRTYLKSFVWVSVLGLTQFVLYMMGINFFVAQHWTASFARINGFCYEPSYYSTYLLPGFVVYAYLFEKHNEDVLSYREIKRDLLIVSIALILSTSRMGWLMMAVWIGLRIIFYSLQLIKRRIAVKTLGIFSLLGIVMIGFIIAFLYIIKNKKWNFLLNGLGLFGMSGHSRVNRWNRLMDCFEIFKESPIFGVSLGGVDAQIAHFDGYSYVAGKNGAASSIIGELFIANGIVGLIPFVGYMISLVHKKRGSTDAIVLRALRWAVVFEIGILCMNQNILRVYVWVLIAVLSATEFALRKFE